MNDILVTAVCSSLGTLLVVSVIRDIRYMIRKAENYYPDYKYVVDEWVVCNQGNGKPVKCRIIDRRVHIKTREPMYRIAVHYSKDDIRIETIKENDIQCTLIEFGTTNLP